jgi:hypothetical protein
MKSKSDLGAFIVMYAVKNKKGDVIALLLKNGVVVPSNSNDMQVALVVTEMLKNSKSFEKDFTKLVQSQDVVSGLTSNMSGAYSYMGGAYSNVNGFEYTPIDLGTSIFKTTPATTTSTPATTTSTSTADKISGFEKYLLLGQGLFSDYTKMKENEAKVKLANASVELEKIQSESGNGSAGSKGSFSSTTLYVVLGLAGLGMLGFLTYKMVKK